MVLGPNEPALPGVRARCARDRHEAVGCLASSASQASMACGSDDGRGGGTPGSCGDPVTGKVGHLHQVVELVGHQ